MSNKQQGYYTLPNGINLHFSINAWYELERETGLRPQQFLEQFIEEGSKEEPNEFILLDLLTDLVLASATAYNLEEGIESDLNRYKIRNDLVNLNGVELAELNDTLLNNSTVNYSLGKQMPQTK